MLTDGGSWTNTSWYALRDQMHYLEIDWRAATSAGANDGGVTLWIDGVQKQSITTVDNDTRQVDFVRWGAVSGVDTGTRGTYFFDAFESRTDTYIGPDPNAPMPPPPPAIPDLIFADGFESGSFSAWSASATDGGDLSVSAAAAMVGTRGMQAVLDDNNSIYVTDWSPFEESRYRARFYFDPNSLPMTSGDAHYLLYAMNSAGTVLARVEFRFSSGAYQVRAALINDGTTFTNTAWVTISDASHYLEIDWRAATGAGANNGALSFWVDGTLRDEKTGIDNDTRRVDLVRLGAVNGVDAGTRGTTYFDAFESRRQSYIGPAGGGLRGEGEGAGQGEQTTPEGGQAGPALSGLGEAFVPNAGQFHRDVEFAVHGLGGDTLFFTEQGAVVVLPPAPLAIEQEPGTEPEATPEPAPPMRAVLRIRFEGANRRPEISGADQLPGVVNYFLGDDPSGWRTRLPTYGAITYEDLYPGIDLRYEGSLGLLKGTFIVDPGADPALIRWRYPGTQNVTLDAATGDLAIDLVPAACEVRGPEAGCAVVERSPLAWQEINGERISVSARYVVETNGTIGLALGAYDRDYPLVIDPTLTYSTYLGGWGWEMAYGIAVDASGEMLVAGVTLSSNFPTMNPIQPVIGGSYDAFVARFDASGSALVYSTYLGGSAHDEAGGIAVDASGYAYVSGHTASTNFPTANPFQPAFAGDYDAFIAKLAADGSVLVYSTYLGGSATDRNVDIAITAAGEATVVGSTWSANFPTQNAYDPTLNGAPDVFISRLNAGGSALLFSTYFGGSSLEEGLGVALDGSGNVAFTGRRWSTNLPVLNAAQPTCALPAPCYDAFVTMLSSSGGSLVFSTYLGGNAGEDGYGIAADSAGGVYVTGRTWSTDFPTQDAIQPSFQGGDSDAFVVAYAASGARVFGTYFGGSARDDGYDIEVDGQGSIYVAGLTGSTNFPLVNPIQATYGGAGDDGFVARFFPNGSSVAYSTYLGGNLSDQVRAIDVRGNTDVYVSGSTGSTNFPLVSPYQAVLAGYNDIFISRITDSTPPHEDSRTIAYDYDPLYRLTAADYDDGTYLHYTYDPVGNRLTETTLAGTTNYVYDDANRLTSVGGVPYTWSDNGNLLSDGTYTYAYDHANRLTSATWGTLAYGFSYNGLGDRLRQTVAGTPTTYSLDIVGGLTQVLSDGTNAYLYGNGRIGEEQPGGWQYHLGDALGSVRQLVDASVSVTLSRAYEPFGDPLLTTGTGTSIFAFAGEQRDGTGLVYLRARYYVPTQGRFLTRDVWEGDPNQPMSYNAWLYVYANPANSLDPSGTCPDDDGDGRCDPWWVHCRMITDPTLLEQCIECHTPRAGLPNFDPFTGPTNLPIAGWGSTPREARAYIVLQWLDAYRGPDAWWRGAGIWFDARAMKAWILQREGGQLEPQYVTSVQGPDNAVGAMARILNRDVGATVGLDWETAVRLSEYTAFFNPLWRDPSRYVFDEGDWGLLMDPPLQSYVDTIMYAGIAALGEPTNWWRESEMTLHRDRSEWRYVYLYRFKGSTEHFFFGTLGQFVYHGIGRP